MHKDIHLRLTDYKIAFNKALVEELHTKLEKLDFHNKGVCVIRNTSKEQSLRAAIEQVK